MNLEELSDDDRGRWERYISTGLHAFLFVDHVAPGERLRDVVDALRGTVPGDDPAAPDYEPPSDHVVVLAATETLGPHGAFVHLWAPPGDLAALEDFVAGPLWDLGIRCDYGVQGTAYTSPTGGLYPLKVKRCDVVAFVRIWLGGKKGRDPFAIMADLSELDGFQGAATVFGSYDVLLVLEGKKIGDVAKVVMGKLRQIRGIARTETAFADYHRYDDDYVPYVYT
jgi:hypothetical protein